MSDLQRIDDLIGVLKDLPQFNTATVPEVYLISDAERRELISYLARLRLYMATRLSFDTVDHLVPDGGDHE